MNRISILSVVALACLTRVGSFGEDWPQWRGPRADGTWSETGVFDRFPGPELKPVWRAPIGSGYSGPTVSRGRVFVMDRRTEPGQVERVLCFSEKDGKPLWSFQYACPYVGIDYQAGPRACVTIDGDRAYAIGAMGHLHCLDFETGKVIWAHDCNREYRIEMPNWGIAAAPLVVDDLVIAIIGGEKASVVAFRKDNGQEAWRSLNELIQYSAPLLVEQAGKKVVVCWTGESVAGLDPTTGKPFWRIEFQRNKMPIGVASPVLNGDRLFLTSFYDGSMMFRLNQNSPQAEFLWQEKGLSERQTKAIHSIISTPLFHDNHIYGVDSYGELRCLKAENGDRVWENLTATPKARWSTIHFVQNGDRSWLFNERGELIIAKLSPQGYDEISRTKLLKPTLEQLNQRGGVCWAHPAFANGHVFARNDEELVCASLLTASTSQK